MMASNKNIPVLRFKEFGSEWDPKSLKEVLTLVTRPLKMDDEQTYSLVTVKRRYEGIIHRGDYKGKEVKVKSQFFLKTNDFLISKRQISHNACGIVPKELSGSIVSNEYSVFIPQNNLDIQYFNYFCRQPKVSKTFFLSSTGVHIEKMIFKVDVWFKCKFSFPSLPEQQKIASFLSSIDEKIQQLTRKKELLEQYKKGVMQQLFSGRLRFKDEHGKDYPEWEETVLGAHIDLVSGYAFKGADISDKPGGIPLMRGINITEGEIRHGSDIDRFYHGNIDGFNEIVLKEGDLVLGMDGSKVGKNSSLITKMDEGSLLVQRVARIKCKNSADMTFIYQYIRSHHFYRYVDMVNTSSGIPHISPKQIRDFKIAFPVKNEQQKIGKLLQKIDEKIDSIRVQLIQTETFKKGLLQQMFV